MSERRELNPDLTLPSTKLCFGAGPPAPHQKLTFGAPRFELELNSPEELVLPLHYAPLILVRGKKGEYYHYTTFRYF